MITRKKAAVGLCLALAPIWALAACQSDTSDGKDYYIVLVSGFNPPPFSPADIPIGGVIYEAKATGLSFTNARMPSVPSVACSPAITDYSSGIGTPGANNIYPTAIPNIGIRILSPVGRPFPFLGNSSWESATWYTGYAPTIQLIKTGNITAPGVLTGAYARFSANYKDGQTLVEYHFASPLVVTPKVPTCKVESPSSIPVPMGHVIAATAFSGVGSTAPPQSFSIKLRCSGGDPETTTRPFVTLTDATNPGNTSKTLSLSRDAAAATGVGIQILKDDVVLGYGPDSSAVGNTNQWFAGTVRQGQAVMSIDLRARYVQTAPKITSGSANALATYTLSYQ